MRYDRPVRELLVECCLAMPEPFTMANVLVWFGRHYPDVAVNTVRTQFHTLLGRGELPVVRDARGGYRRSDGGTPMRERGTDTPPPPRPQTAPTGHVVLLGCVKSKAATLQPARALYTSPLWHRRLSYAERAGLPWFVLSAKHGVVDPDDVISPYDVSLRAATSAYRAAWGEFVAQQLATRFSLRGLVVEVHAGDPYVDAVRGPLTRLGAIVEDPVDASSMGETLAWYDAPPARPAPPAAVHPDLDARVTAALAALQSQTAALRMDDVLTAPADLVDRPGLYSWWVDAAGAADLSRGLGIAVEPGLIYAGQAGATSPGRATTDSTLRSRIIRNHFCGTRGASTLRQSLGSILDHGVDDQVSERWLTDWMRHHLGVALWPTGNPEMLLDIEKHVVRILDPPLNLDHVERSDLRRQLRQLRKAARI